MYLRRGRDGMPDGGSLLGVLPVLYVQGGLVGREPAVREQLQRGAVEQVLLLGRHDGRMHLPAVVQEALLHPVVQEALLHPVVQEALLHPQGLPMWQRHRWVHEGMRQPVIRQTVWKRWGGGKERSWSMGLGRTFGGKYVFHTRCS